MTVFHGAIVVHGASGEEAAGLERSLLLDAQRDRCSLELLGASSDGRLRYYQIGPSEEFAVAARVDIPVDPQHDTIVHIAGHDVQVGHHLRQRCSWCGAVLVDQDLTLVQVPVGQEGGYPTWPVGALVQINGLDGTSVTTVLEHVDGEPVPAECCARLSPEVTL